MNDSTKQYRSGLLMGLTVAETLLLTLFLLLLLFSAFFIKGKEEIQSKEKLISNLQNEKARLLDKNKLLEELKQKIEVASGRGFDDFFKELKIDKAFEHQIKQLQQKNEEIQKNNEVLSEQLKVADTINKRYEPILAEIQKLYPSEKDIVDLTANKLKNICEFEKKTAGKGLDELISKSQELEKKNGDLNKQIIHLVDAQKGLGKGADYPPCWLDDQNKIEYIFNIIINDFGIELFDIKNENRTEDKIKLPIQHLIYENTIATEIFLDLLRPLFDLCVENNCRHFVRIYDETTKKQTFKKNLLTVETYFYKYLTNSNFHEKHQITATNF